MNCQSIFVKKKSIFVKKKINFCEKKSIFVKKINFCQKKNQFWAWRGFLFEVARFSAFFQPIGYLVNHHVLRVIALRYGQPDQTIHFEDFVLCIVRLQRMISECASCCCSITFIFSPWNELLDFSKSVSEKPGQICWIEFFSIQLAGIFQAKDQMNLKSAIFSFDDWMLNTMYT